MMTAEVLNMIIREQRYLKEGELLQRGDVLIQSEKQLTKQQAEMAGVWYMNAGAPRLAKCSREQLQVYWKDCGLIGNRTLSHNRFFRVTIFHFQLVQLIRLTDKDALTTRYQETDSFRTTVKAEHNYTERVSNDKLLQQVVKAAIASLYVLALEVGEVIVQLSGDGLVQPVSASDRIVDDHSYQLAKQQFAETMALNIVNHKQMLSIMLGADPEVAIVNATGQLVSASYFFGENKGAAIGTDSIRVKGKLIYPLLELRPRPTSEPAQLLMQIQRLLMQASERINNSSMRLVAGAMPIKGIALGGHIHLSGVPLTSRLLRLLDSLITIPLALIEAESGKERRPRYGRLGDYRRQAYGGFEYRTLPSWLISPMVAKAVFALTKMCAEDALQLDTVPQLSMDMMRAYYQADYAQLRSFWPQIKQTIFRMTRYKEYESYIDPLITAIDQQKRWDERLDIRKKWRIPV
ncbi:hypothetical protein ACFSTH_03805 [Paenibacillus yanchengensis]|uniref:Phage portal protein n=1 Tax=Paenibacillus yanchengensis TaxID=2035833 RepID=A0ABW4YJJ4_9BACL